ncbi:hypothetical protein O181_026048 [Austropuccinia psidii MF-1]|uniref:Uncharacterized protein n=1 Tax=Austropuccinia psidii MF-1 TaxID=1389203 RepID=A0A9Q3CLT0_9BASI|nr:hypothetical protein [Austropuccinia psidii MF-1]
MTCHGHPPVCNVVDLVKHGESVLNVIRQRGEENEELVKLYESGNAGQQIPQGSIKSFRQYADYMTLSSLPIWPITPVKVSLFLLFRLLMGDVTNGTPLRNAYLRSLARSLEHYREETAKYFISRWPEAGGWIIRDGRGDPESRNDITHDILRICKLGQTRPIHTLLDFDGVHRLVTGNNPSLTPDAWATRRRLSARWVRDRDSANLPERQYAGGKFIGDPPKPPPLSSRSTHWNRHLHDLRERSEESTWISSFKQSQNESLYSSPTSSPCKPLMDSGYEDQVHMCVGERSGGRSSRPSFNNCHTRPLALNLHGNLSSADEFDPTSLASSKSLSFSQILNPLSCAGLAPITPSHFEERTSHGATSPSASNCVIPSLVEAGLHPSYFPLPCSLEPFSGPESRFATSLRGGTLNRGFQRLQNQSAFISASNGGREYTGDLHGLNGFPEMDSSPSSGF